MTYTGAQREHYDVVVVGSGPCGTGAALEAAALGYTVIVVEGVRDRVARDWYFIGDTPLTPAGTQFEDARGEAFASAGIDLVFVDAVEDLGRDRGYRFEGLSRAFLARRMIYCPDGVVRSNAYVPRVALSAWDIAPVHGDRGVAVIGTGIRAADSALFVALWVDVTLYDSSDVPEPWRTANAREPRIRRRPSEPPVQHRVEADSVVVRQGTTEEQYEGIILAEDYLADWDVLACPELAGVLQERARTGDVQIAGLMNGIPCTDHSALFLDGQAAARRLLRS